MADGSTRVVYAALAGNAAIAVAKFGAFALSGSTAMLTEAIHSLVDTADQILLLVGEKRSREGPDPDHPLGHGMEAYFWSFIVALMVFLLGGVVGVYQGVRQILAPHAIGSPLISLGVLAVAAVFEGASLGVGLREYKRFVRGRPIRLWAFIKVSKDPSLYTSLLEDSAAIIGIAVAAIGVGSSWLFHIGWADGAASVAIGLLLTLVACFLVNETRSLIAGEAVAPPVLAALKQVIEADDRIVEILDIATLHLGPRSILVALTLSFRPDMTVAGLGDAIRDLTEAMQKADGRVAYLYVRPGRERLSPSDRGLAPGR
jgi:cation diffusion facilitator family transporter